MSEYITADFLELFSFDALAVIGLWLAVVGWGLWGELRALRDRGDAR